MMASGSNERSQVWLYFSKNTNKEVVCNKCSIEVRVKDGSTTNLHKHLKRHHSIEVATTTKKSTSKKMKESDGDGESLATKNSSNPQQSLKAMWTKLPTTSRRHQEISKAIAKYIAYDMRPLNSVNDKGFCQLIATLEPRFNMESRGYVTRTLLPTMYQELKVEVQDQLKKATFISMTTDGWTGRNTKAFTTVTSQYINEDWELCNNILATQETTERHTAENLAAEFDAVIEEWNLKKDLISATTDNAKNIVLAIDKVGVVHVRCMAHTLNLGSQKVLKISSVSRVCSKIRAVVKFFRHSIVAANLLRKAKTQLGIDDLKPIIDVSTRWNSSLDMMERYLTLRPAIGVVLAKPEMRGQCDSITDCDLDLIEQLVKVLQIMKTSTNMLSSGCQPTASLILPLKASIIKQMDSDEYGCPDGDHNSVQCLPIVLEAKMTIKHDLETRYTDGKTVAFLEECAFLDPRFKSLSWLPESKQQQVHSRILALIAEEMDCQLAQIEMAESGETTAQSSETDPDIAIAG